LLYVCREQPDPSGQPCHVCRYVTGDNRFRSYCKTNPRKMVKVWAEKELRNLARLSAAGVRCPKPITLQMHVLVMEFIGSGGVAAPRLKDADVTPAQLRGFYLDMVLLIRTLYQTCNLVHADLSEYNILVHQVRCSHLAFAQCSKSSLTSGKDLASTSCLDGCPLRFSTQQCATLHILWNCTWISAVASTLPILQGQQRSNSMAVQVTGGRVAGRAGHN